MNRKFAFTLAEVLITLTILGVVAAITVPSIIQRQTERTTVTKVKKFYASLDQAYEVAKVEHGPVNTWGNGHIFEPGHAQEFYELLIKPNFRIAKDCGLNNNGKCIFSGNMKLLNNNNYNTPYSNNNYYKVLLSDGASLWFRVTTNVGKTDAGIWYDINGPKEPNQLGNDIFVFRIDFKGVHSYIVTLSDNSKNAFDPTDCNDTKGAGWACSAYIIKYGNMNYLHK